MTNGWVFFALGTLICLGGFLNGLRFWRISDERAARMVARSPNMTADRVKSFGRLFMIFAPLFWLLLAAMCFGLLGPVEGIQTINLHEAAR